MTTHSSSVAWRIPTDSKALQRVKDVTPHAQMQYFFFASVSSVPMGIVHGGGMVSGIMGTLAELTPQSLYSSFPPLCLLGDPHSCLGYIWLWQGLSVWFSFHSDCHRSAASLFNSLKCSPLSQTVAPMWGSDPCFSFLTHPGPNPVLLTMLFFVLLPLSYRVLHGSIHSL